MPYKYLALFVIFSSSSCYVLFPEKGAKKCPEDVTSTTCDGTVLVVCDPNESKFELREDCDRQGQACNANAKSCVPLGCGDGIPDQGEECDDGNDIEDDSCTSACILVPNCGNGVVDVGEECDDNNQANGDGCSAVCIIEFIVGCGDGVVQAPESCDDGNTLKNDGCDQQCQLEADEFVLCGGPANGNGDLTTPFNSLFQAVNDSGTLDNEVVMILPQSQSCLPEGVGINKPLIIQGLADATDPAAPARPTINGGGGSAIEVKTGAATKVIIRDLIITSNSTVPAVLTQNKAQVALLRVQVSNLITGSAGTAVGCQTNSNTGTDGVMLIDQSEIINSPTGGLQVENQCRAIVANSLFRNNGSSTSVFGAISVKSTTPRILAIYSTFDLNDGSGNTGNSPNPIVDCDDSGTLVLDSSIANDTNFGTGIFVDDDCDASFTDTFSETPPPGLGNVNVDPLFVSASPQAPADFHLSANSPVIDAANPNQVSLAALFDALAVFGVNPFIHDFAGNTRPQGGVADMGMFEEQ